MHFYEAYYGMRHVTLLCRVHYDEEYNKRQSAICGRVNGEAEYSAVEFHCGQSGAVSTQCTAVQCRAL